LSATANGERSRDTKKREKGKSKDDLAAGTKSSKAATTSEEEPAEAVHIGAGNDKGPRNPGEVGSLV